MKTKRFILAFAVVALMGNTQLFAQETRTINRERKIDMNELLEKRIQRMENQLALDEATAAKFAPLYKEYMNALRQCHPAVERGERCAECTDAERTARIERRMDCRQKMLDTQKKYYKEFKKILNARQLEMVFGRHHMGQFGNQCGHGRYGSPYAKKGYKFHSQCDRFGHAAHNHCNQ